MSKPDFDRIAEAIEYIETHVQDQPDLNLIAEHVHLSPFHFQRLFTEWAGVSPKKFLQYLTLQHAKQRLAADQNLLATAWETGLSGSGRLHDLFVKLEGVSPGVYKSGGEGLTIQYGLHASPFGDMLIARADRGICKWIFTGSEHTPAIRELEAEWPHAKLVRNDATNHELAQSLFGKQMPAPFSVWIKGSPFQLKVWEALLRVPEGNLVSYGQIAHAIGKPAAVRAVGTAIGRNPIAFLIPCHRVIRQAGMIGQYRWGATRKKAIIGWEAARAFGE